MKRINKLLFVLCFFLLLFTSCTTTTKINIVEIENGEYVEIEEGKNIELILKENKEITGSVEWTVSNDCVSVDRYGLVTALKEGEAIVTVTYKEYSDSIKVIVTPVDMINVSIYVDYETYNVGDTIIINSIVTPIRYKEEIKYSVLSGNELIDIEGNTLLANSSGEVCVQASVRSFVSNVVSFNIEEEILVDPYVDMSKEEFYANYKKATSYMDSYYRTLHGFMSGDISDQDQAPTLSKYIPSIDGVRYRNSDALYSKDKNTYYIVNAYGEIVNTIYKGGAYVTLEEVAAYMLAFNEIPANYITKKSSSPTGSVWGKYLRCNNTKFSGDTSRYPYEPELPDISGCGGSTTYYEMDLGTTGTDCDPSYSVRPYNDGSKITRGAARIVYTRYDKNGNSIIDINERYVFYTYNHYNDFQEYLNYEGGWGEMFGNITGGGSLSSKYDYNPTPYISSLKVSFKELNNLTIQNVNIKNSNLSILSSNFLF